MGLFRRKKKAQKHCPNCRKPVPDGAVFCDSCGLRLVPPPTCSQCHQPLAPETNFCEACGTPVGTVPAPEIPPSTDFPADAKKAGKPTKSRNQKKKRTAPPAPESVPAVVTTLSEPVPENNLPSGIPGREPPALSVAPVAPAMALQDRKSLPAGASQKILLVSFVLVCSVILVLVVMAGFLKLPPVAPSPPVPVPASPDGPPLPSDPALLQTTPAPSGSLTRPVDLSPGPTGEPPESFRIWLWAERDPVSHMVSVIFDGGKGQSAVREIEARLFRSDGSVLTETFRPKVIGQGVSMQGTKFVDRLVVNITYNNGERYTVVDKIFEYKERS